MAHETRLSTLRSLTISVLFQTITPKNCRFFNELKRSKIGSGNVFRPIRPAKTSLVSQHWKRGGVLARNSTDSLTSVRTRGLHWAQKETRRSSTFQPSNGLRNTRLTLLHYAIQTLDRNPVVQAN